MTVRPFPPAEPWPAELFDTFGIRDLEQLERDVHAELDRRRAATVDTAVCPDCGDTTHPSETVCEGCGTHLSPKNTAAAVHPVTHGREAVVVIKGCTCGDAGLCTACVFASYDRDPFAQDLARGVDIVTRPANVVQLPAYSKKVS